MRKRFVRRAVNVAHWKKTVLTDSQTITNDTIKNYTYKLNDLFLEEGDIGPLFRFYRLRAVKIRFIYTVNTAQAAGNNGHLGWMYFLRNQSLTTTQGGLSTPAYFLNANCAIRRLDRLDGTNRYSQFYVKVKPAEVNFDGVNNAQYMTPGRNDWITTDGQGMNIIHRGVDMFVHPGVGSAGTLDVWTTYYFTTKQAR